MFSFFKSNKKLPEFKMLGHFEHKSHYFKRAALWNWIDAKSIVVIDPQNPRILSMDPWPQLIFTSADGQQTVSEFIIHMAGKYSGEVPELLDHTVINELNKLVQLKIIVFSESKERPSAEYDSPRKSTHSNGG